MYVFRTRLPVAGGPKSPLPLDLHVLSLPLAFILSQDQTLRLIIHILLYSKVDRVMYFYPTLNTGALALSLPLFNC